MGALDTQDLRTREFARLDAAAEVYLDYTGGALYPASLVRRHADFLSHCILGNPHSENPVSNRARAVTDAARRAVLQCFDADPAESAVVFTANASAGFRLVGEGFPFRNPGAPSVPSGWMTRPSRRALTSWVGGRSRPSVCAIASMDVPWAPCARRSASPLFPATSID